MDISRLRNIVFLNKKVYYLFFSKNFYIIMKIQDITGLSQ